MHHLPAIEVFGLRWDLSSIIMITVSCVIVYILARIGTRNLSVNSPGRMQNFVEWIVEFVHNLIASTMDMKRGKDFIMLGITLVMFIFVANMLGLPFSIVTVHDEPFSLFGREIVSESAIQAEQEKGKYYALLWWKSPTADAAVTMMLALISITLVHILGLKWNTKHYLKHYFEPHFLFFPLNLLKEASKLLTLGLRLFGNIFAGEIMISVILMAGIAGVIPLILWQGFSMFIGAIQAFVFAMLTMVYISQATEHEEKH